jgi:hypothetical protein
MENKKTIEILSTGTIQVYDAIREMERISQAGDNFSFSFYKYNRETRTGGDLARIARARLRKKAPDSKIEHSSYKLFFMDMDSGRPLNCWQMLIVEFNGMECTL